MVDSPLLLNSFLRKNTALGSPNTLIKSIGGTSFLSLCNYSDISQGPEKAPF